MAGSLSATCKGPSESATVLPVKLRSLRIETWTEQINCNHPMVSQIRKEVSDMTGLEWFLILLLVAVGGMYVFGRRPGAGMYSRPTYRGTEDNPRGNATLKGHHADEDSDMQSSRRHGGCC